MPNYPEAKAVKRGIDLSYGKKQITASVTSGILQGKSVKRISDDLQSRITDMNRTSAVRAARTAITGAQNAGRLDSYLSAEKMGIGMKKEWLATLDGRTRHSHAILDGEQAATDKKFSNGCRYPGDPQAPSWEIYNCRCTLVAAVDGVDTSDAQRRDRYGIFPDQTYVQWENSKRGEGYLQEELMHAEKVQSCKAQYNSMEKIGLQRLPDIDTFAETCYSTSPKYENLVARYENLSGTREWSAVEFNPETLTDHYARHNNAYGFTGREDYAKAAIEFVNSTKDKATLISEDGVRRFYQADTNIFASVYPDGTVSSFYKPRQKEKYWGRQAEKYGSE